MATEFNGLLTATVFLPAVGAVLLLLVPNRREGSDRVIRGVAVAVAVADLVLALLVFAFFDRGGTPPASSSLTSLPGYRT